MKLAYDIPVPGLNEYGHEVTCNQQIIITEEDAIKLSRYAQYQKLGVVPSKTDKELLDDYIVIHWAYPIT